MSGRWLSQVALSGVVALSSGLMNSAQVADSRVVPLRSVFARSRTPAAALIATPAANRAELPFLRDLYAKPSADDDGVLVVFRKQEDVDAPCSRALPPQCCAFTTADEYNVEVTPVLKTAVLGTPATIKAQWTRVMEGGNLDALGIPGLEGVPVVAALNPPDLISAKYVVLYRRKHWTGASPEGGACGGHTHLQATWAVLPGGHPSLPQD
jgi:hypothetical protein